MEEFNILKDFYFPIQEQEKLYSSNAYQNLKNNNIDTAELDGIEKDPNAGKIEFKELSKEDNQIFFKDVTDFIFKDLPKDTIISLIKGGTNATQFLNNIVYATGITPADDNIMLNEKLDKVKSQLDNLQEDSPLVSKLMAIVAQDAAFTYPIYKKLDKAGVPKAWSLPIAFGLGGTLAFDKAETFFVDSAAMRGLKDLIGVEPDTPIEEMYDKTIQALEYSAFGKIADTIFNGAKAVKKMNLQQPATATAGAGIAGAGAMELQEQTPDLNVENPDLDQEKKTLNFDEQEQISSPMPGDDEMASAGSVFGPIFKSIVRETAKNYQTKELENKYLIH